MTETLTVSPRQTPATFLHSDYAPDLNTLRADIAFLGIPYGQAYNYDDIVNDQTNGPTAMRRFDQLPVSQVLGGNLIRQ